MLGELLLDIVISTTMMPKYFAINSALGKYDDDGRVEDEHCSYIVFIVFTVSQKRPQIYHRINYACCRK